MKLATRLSVVTVSAVALVACVSNEWSADPTSPHSRVPVGSTFVLERRVRIPAGKTRVFFRGGRSGAVPECSVEVRKLDDEAVQTVEPGSFRIRRVQNLATQVVSNSRRERPSARACSMGGGSTGNIMIYEGYHLWLDAADQPNLMRLSCYGVFDDQAYAKPPSVQEIQLALSEIGRIELAEPAGG